jgi:hypothetical protein
VTPEVRDALRRIDTPIRWLPDLLAVRGDAAYLVDAKWTNRQDTGFYDIEWSSLVALDEFYRCLRLPVALVWYDLGVSFTWELLADGAPLRRGHWKGSGSGTPFVLWPKDEAHPFTDVFGIGAAVIGPPHQRMNVLRVPVGLDRLGAGVL